MHKNVRVGRCMNVLARRTPDMRRAHWTNARHTWSTRWVFIVCSSAEKLTPFIGTIMQQSRDRCRCAGQQHAVHVLDYSTCALCLVLSCVLANTPMESNGQGPGAHGLV